MAGRRRVVVTILVGLLALTGLGSAVSAGPPRTAGPRVLFFGDSLVGGTGAVPRRPVMVRTAADRLGWTPVVDAFGGTGYTTGGAHGRPYATRLRHDGFLHRARYTTVVLEGGTNDAHHGSLPGLRAAALQAVDLVRRAQPQARLVLLGVYAPPGAPLAPYLAAERVLRQVAADRDLGYVSQLAWSQAAPAGFLSADRYHPSDAGYAVMARALAVELAAVLKSH